MKEKAQKKRERQKRKIREGKSKGKMTIRGRIINYH